MKVKISEIQMKFNFFVKQYRFVLVGFFIVAVAFALFYPKKESAPEKLIELERYSGINEEGNLQTEKVQMTEEYYKSDLLKIMQHTNGLVNFQIKNQEEQFKKLQDEIINLKTQIEKQIENLSE